MEILWNVLLGLGAALFGYLLGAIPTGVVIGKVFYHVDPRDYGSHASGGTNSGRVFGKRVGIIVIVLDILKAVIAFWACWAIIKFTPIIEASWLFDHGDIFPWIAIVGVAFGHCWPVFLLFKGGKAVTSYMALVGGTSWLGFIMCFASFFLPFAFKKIVSWSSLLSGLFLLIFEWVMCIIVLSTGNNIAYLMWTFGLQPSGVYFGLYAAVSSTIVYLILVFRHWQNIQRMKKGEEKPVKWGKGLISK